MSQHSFRTTSNDRPVNVVLGWDRPLGYFFLWVADLSPRSAQEFLYHNLDDPGSSDADLDYYRARLTALGIQVPETMFQEVLSDCIHNTGNRSVSYLADGSFTG